MKSSSKKATTFYVQKIQVNPVNPVKNKSCLKKQSQFIERQIGVNSYLKGYYEDLPAYVIQKNKAN